ncbi:collagen alpha-1(VII) chain-like [Heterodontus francisci]|uniref:collagen alpha-1(VII) chain-like n=1 Tax=Heterodontus francisci TaxID=7792 RepID=UPI00355C7E2B
MEVSDLISKLTCPKLCLWRTVFECLYKQQHEDLFCDAILYAEGEGIPAHRCVLAAFSPFFLQHFSSRDARSQRVPLELPGLKAATLKALVRFMYTAEIQLPREEIGEFLEAARSLHVLGVAGEPGTLPAAEPRDSEPEARMLAGTEPEGERLPPPLEPGGTALPPPVLPRGSPKALDPCAQRRTPSQVALAKPKAPTYSSSLLQRSRGKGTSLPGNPPPSKLVVSWRRMKISRPVATEQADTDSTASAPTGPKRPWRQKRGEPLGCGNQGATGVSPHWTPTPPSSLSTLRRDGTPCLKPLEDLHREEEGNERLAVESGPDWEPKSRSTDSGQERAQGSAGQAARRKEEGEAMENLGEQPSESSGQVGIVKELTSRSVSGWTGRSPSSPDRRQEQLRRKSGLVCGPQRETAYPAQARDTQQTVHGAPRPEEGHQAARCLIDQRGKMSGREGSHITRGPVLGPSHQGSPCASTRPKSAGSRADPNKQGVVKHALAQGGKRSSCQDVPGERSVGIKKVKLQKLNYSSKWVVTPALEKRDPDPARHLARGQNVEAAEQWTSNVDQARTEQEPQPPAGTGRSQVGGEEKGVAVGSRRRQLLSGPGHFVADLAKDDWRPETLGLGEDQRPETPVLPQDQRPGGLALGEDRRPETLALGEDQRPGGLALGEDQRPGGPCLGEDQRPGGPCLGEDQRPGGPCLGEDRRLETLDLGEDRRPGGLALGEDQRPGGPCLGEDQRPGGPCLGEDQRPGGPGLGEDRRPGGLGLGEDRRPGGLGLGEDRRPETLDLGEDRRPGGLALGEDRRPGGLALGEDQRPGGPCLGEDQRPGGPCLGEDQRPGGPCLGEDRRPGGPCLGEDRRPGGPGLGEDRRPGGLGLGEDRRPGGLGLGEDRRPGGLGLGEDRRPGGLGLGEDRRPGGRGLGEDRRPGGLGLGEDRRPGGLGLGEDRRPGGLGLGEDRRPGGLGLGEDRRPGGLGLGEDRRPGGLGLGEDRRPGGLGLGEDRRPGGLALGGDRRPGGLALGEDRRPETLGLEEDQKPGGLGLGEDQRSGSPGLGEDQRTGGPGLGEDQRPETLCLGEDQRLETLGLGEDQRSGGLGLGEDQRSGGLGLGEDQRSGGLGLGEDQRSGGLGLGEDQRFGGLGLGEDQRSGGLGLGEDQRSGGLGLGEDQRSGGLGLGEDQRSGGLGLGEVQRLETLGLGEDWRPETLGLGEHQGPGGPGLGEDQWLETLGLREMCPGQTNRVSSASSWLEESWTASAAMFPREPHIQGAPDHPQRRPDQWGLALPQVTGHVGISPPTDHWGFAQLRFRGHGGAGTLTDQWEFARLQVGGQHRMTDDPTASSSSSGEEDGEVDVGDGRDVPLPLVTVRPEASPPPSPPLGCTEIDVIG